MAWKKIYKCKDCGYEAEVYEGSGLLGQHMEVVSCPDCKTVQNLVVGGVIGDVAPSFRSTVNRLCLRCGSDRIVKWDFKTCPKCGGDMQEVLGDKEFWT